MVLWNMLPKDADIAYISLDLIKCFFHKMSGTSAWYFSIVHFLLTYVAYINS